MAGLDAAVEKYAKRGKTVELVGLNRPSAELHRELSGKLTTAH